MGRSVSTAVMSSGELRATRAAAELPTMEITASNGQASTTFHVVDAASRGDSITEAATEIVRSTSGAANEITSRLPSIVPEINSHGSEAPGAFQQLVMQGLERLSNTEAATPSHEFIGSESPRHVVATPAVTPLELQRKSPRVLNTASSSPDASRSAADEELLESAATPEHQPAQPVNWTPLVRRQQVAELVRSIDFGKSQSFSAHEGWKASKWGEASVDSIHFNANDFSWDSTDIAKSLLKTWVQSVFSRTRLLIFCAVRSARSARCPKRNPNCLRRNTPCPKRKGRELNATPGAGSNCFRRRRAEATAGGRKLPPVALIQRAKPMCPGVTVQ